MMVVARYLTDTETVARIDKDGTGFFLMYGPEHNNPCQCGPFKTLSDAERGLSTKSPTARRTNSMCNYCINRECVGTANMVWSGCVYRKLGA